MTETSTAELTEKHVYPLDVGSLTTEEAENLIHRIADRLRETSENTSDEELKAEAPGQARPFLKWAGGKGKLLDDICGRLPPAWTGDYHEPFLGGGAVFFRLASTGKIADGKRAHLGDSAPFLAQAFLGVQRNVEGVIKHLKTYQNTREFFEWVRGRLNTESADVVERAAMVIYLNKVCFNGLFRVNSKGEFNTSFGKYANPNICDEDVLRACAAVLRGRATVRSEDFWMVTKRAKKGDFVYLDPPYLPVEGQGEYTGYSPEGFGDEDHRNVAAVFRVLTQRGVFVMASNSDVPTARELYKGSNIQVVSARRSISRKAEDRKTVGELLITNY